jgi:hypothetical protein
VATKIAIKVIDERSRPWGEARSPS